MSNTWLYVGTVCLVVLAALYTYRKYRRDVKRCQEYEITEAKRQRALEELNRFIEEGDALGGRGLDDTSCVEQSSRPANRTHTGEEK